MISKFYIPDDLGEKDCPDCDGQGYYNDSECCNAKIIHGICSECGEHTTESICERCEGTGKIPRTEQDAWDDYVHECESKNERNNGK